MKGQHRIVAGTKAARQGAARNQKLHVAGRTYAGGDRALALEIDEHNRKVEAQKSAKLARKGTKERTPLPAVTQTKEYTK